MATVPNMRLAPTTRPGLTDQPGDAPEGDEFAQLLSGVPAGDAGAEADAVAETTEAATEDGLTPETPIAQADAILSLITAQDPALQPTSAASVLKAMVAKSKTAEQDLVQPRLTDGLATIEIRPAGATTVATAGRVTSRSSARIAAGSEPAPTRAAATVRTGLRAGETEALSTIVAGATTPASPTTAGPSTADAATTASPSPAAMVAVGQAAPNIPASTGSAGVETPASRPDVAATLVEPTGGAIGRDAAATVPLAAARTPTLAKAVETVPLAAFSATAAKATEPGQAGLAAAIALPTAAEPGKVQQPVARTVAGRLRNAIADITARASGAAPIARAAAEPAAIDIVKVDAAAATPAPPAGPSAAPFAPLWSAEAPTAGRLAETAPIQPFEAPEQVIERQLDLASEGEWLDQLARDIAGAGGSEGRMRFRLNPERLGSLHVEIEQRDNGTAIRLTADTEAARAIIAEAQPKLMAEARAQGVRLSETHVDLAGGQAGDSRRQDADRRDPTNRTARDSSSNPSEAGARRPRSSSDRYA